MTDLFWLKQAKLLPAGRHTKIVCCADDRSLLIENGPKGYRGYCFRCGPAGFVKHGDFRISDLRRRQAELQLQRSFKVELPDDFTLDIPPSEAVWFYKSSISVELIRHYGFGYSPKMQRLIIPIHKDGALIGVVARSQYDRPKYISNLADPEETIWTSDPDTYLPSTTAEEQAHLPGLCFTEDILSAVRIGRFIRTVAILGTKLSSRQLLAACQGKSPSIAIWLDGDAVGLQDANRLQRSLNIQGREAVVIKTATDPKYHTNKEIKEHLIDRRYPTQDHAA